MRKVFLTVLFLFISQTVQASGTKEYLLMSEYKKAYIEAEQALNVNNNAENNYNMCEVLYNLNDIKSAKKYCNTALNMSDKEKHPDKELRSNVLALIGNIYSNYYKNTSVTFDYYNKAKEMKEGNKDRDNYELAQLYESLGKLYFQTGSKDIANEYINKALELAIEDGIKDKISKIRGYLYLGEINNNPDYYNKALELTQNLGDLRNYKTEGIINRQIAKYYEVNKKDKTKIINYYNKAQEAFSKYSNINSSVITENDNLDTLYNEYPYDIEVNLQLGINNIKENASKAEEYIKRAAEVNPNDARIYLRAAKGYLKNYDKGNLEIKKKITEYVEKAIESAPYSKYVYSECAKIYKETGKNRDAKRLLKLSNNYK